jgi:hypothetical protein
LVKARALGSLVRLNARSRNFQPFLEWEDLNFPHKTQIWRSKVNPAFRKVSREHLVTTALVRRANYSFGFNKNYRKLLLGNKTLCTLPSKKLYIYEDFWFRFWKQSCQL